MTRTKTQTVTTTAPTTVIRIQQQTIVATQVVEVPGNEGFRPPCNSDVPEVVLAAITGGLSAGGIARAQGIHVMIPSDQHPGVYIIAAKFDPGLVAVWGIQGLDRFSWIEPINDLARELTVTRVVPGNGPYFNEYASSVQRAINCLTE